MSHFLKSSSHFISVAGLVLLGGCAGLGGQALAPGMPEADVVARLGRPTNVYPDGNGRVLEYMHGPMGQTTDMARIGADGKLLSYEQVLTMQQFGLLRINQSNQADVLRTVGAPSERGYLPRVQLTTWSYPYKETGVWDSQMTVYFDAQGVMRRLENGPDPRRMPSDGGFN